MVASWGAQIRTKKVLVLHWRKNNHTKRGNRNISIFSDQRSFSLGVPFKCCCQYAKWYPVMLYWHSITKLRLAYLYRSLIVILSTVRKWRRNRMRALRAKSHQFKDMQLVQKLEETKAGEKMQIRSSEAIQTIQNYGRSTWSLPHLVMVDKKHYLLCTH